MAVNYAWLQIWQRPAALFAMNLNQFTLKAQEAVQQAQLLASQNTQQAIETGHLLQGILQVDEHVLPYLFKKAGVNTKALQSALQAIVQGYPKVTGAQPYLSQPAQQAITKAITFMQEMKDEFVTIEHLCLAMLNGNDAVARLLKDVGLSDAALRAAIQELRKGQKVTSASSE